MPDGLVPDEGAPDILTRIVNPEGAETTPWTLILWVNDITPTFDTVLADLDAASWGGYSFVTLDPTQWTTPTVLDGCAKTFYGTEAIQWNVIAGPIQTNFGYALVDRSADVIRFIQRFDEADIQPVAIGGRVLLYPQYTHTSAACGVMAERAKRSAQRKKGYSGHA